MQIRVEAPEGPSSDAHRRRRQCRNWMGLIKMGRRMKLNRSLFALSRSSSRLFRLRSSGLLALSLLGLLSLFRLALSFSAVARHLSPVRERLRQSSIIFPVTLLTFIMSCAVCGFLGFSVAQFEGQVGWAGVSDDGPAAVSLRT